jgi:hypothetical protein
MQLKGMHRFFASLRTTESYELEIEIGTAEAVP